MGKICGKRAYALLERIAYERLGGSPEEAQAAQTLLDELASFGLQGHIEIFPIPTSTIQVAKLEVLEPYQAEYEVAGYGLTGNTDAEGLVADLVYAEGAGEVNLLGTAGKIVLINEGLPLEKYEKLAKAQVAGFISIGGRLWEREDLPRRSIREPYFKHGKIPGVSIRAADALEMVQKGASKVRLTLQQDECEVDSRNVIAEIKGTRYPEEVVVFAAHYDSVPYSAGANDNGAGSVILMELARQFAQQPPLRTVRFCWFGSEELGLLGSFAYVKQHEAELDSIKFVINVDVAGGYLGQNVTFVMAPDALKGYVEILAKQEGLEMGIRHDVYSSDAIPFAEKGIPGINFCRFGAPIHNRHDQLEYISPARLEELASFVWLFSEKTVNATVFPVARELPDNVKKSLQKYLEARRGKDTSK
ncbi:MAG: Zn-dependent exopeptidase M28 [Firmicutes bacterium]|nr:Zn-dependent exopeptidase M28 [Bacillota bacterium]